MDDRRPLTLTRTRYEAAASESSGVGKGTVAGLLVIVAATLLLSGVTAGVYVASGERR